MGAIAEGLTIGKYRTPGSAHDLAYLDAYRNRPTRPSPDECRLTPPLEHELKLRALTIALGYAAEIDLPCCAMLFMSNQDGVVGIKKMIALYQWLTNARSDQAVARQLDERPLFLRTLPHLERCQHVLKPAFGAECRRRLDLSKEVRQEDFSRYGLAA